ncbi:MAG: HlyC/CorC family transporter [Candidatus Eisenbacteria bacterium]|nr:HlyC/CorC family transporter [Candidatus Eisenbacteria bacterium]
MTIVLLIVLGFMMAAFFSGAETALVSINWIRLDYWLERGRGGAKVLERFVADPHRMLGTTLVGTNIAVVMTSSLVSWKLSRLATGWSSGLIGLVSILVVTPLLLILGEIIPKVIGRRHSDVITLKVIHPLRAFYYVLLPVILLTTGVAGALLRPLGIRGQTWRKRLTKEQLRILLTSEGERAGAVDEEETRLISGIFEFGLTTAGEVMVPRTDVIGVTASATIGDAVDLVRAHGFSRLPVLTEDRDRIEGMVHTRDLLGLPRQESIADLIRAVPYVPETKTCDDLFRELQARRQHMAAVIDEHGSLAGIVTLEDLLEELVGEIEDEYDVRQSLIQRIDDDLFMVDGRTDIDAFEESIGVSLPTGEYNTVAGLLLKALGKIPEQGDEAVIEGLEFRVVSASPTRVGKIRVRKRWTKPGETPGHRKKL